MDREERFELLGQMDEESLYVLAEEVAECSMVTLVHEPQCGIVMMRSQDSVEGEVFNLGEILVSEAEVTVDGKLGYCMVMGKALKRALAGAILDGAVESQHPLTDRIVAVLTEARERVEREKLQEWAYIEKTKVNFEVLNEGG